MEPLGLITLMRTMKTRLNVSRNCARVLNIAHGVMYELWRSIPNAHPGGPFGCSDIYKEFGCLASPEKYYAFD
jgi:hypothetical protein